VSRCSFCGRSAVEAGRIVSGPAAVGICADCVTLAEQVLAARIDTDADRLLTDLELVVTNDPARGGLLGSVEDAAIAVVGGAVAWVGPR